MHHFLVEGIAQDMVKTHELLSMVGFGDDDARVPWLDLVRTIFWVIIWLCTSSYLDQLNIRPIVFAYQLHTPSVYYKAMYSARHLYRCLNGEKLIDYSQRPQEESGGPTLGRYILQLTQFRKKENQGSARRKGLRRCCRWDQVRPRLYATTANRLGGNSQCLQISAPVVRALMCIRFLKKSNLTLFDQEFQEKLLNI